MDELGLLQKIISTTALDHISWQAFPVVGCGERRERSYSCSIVGKKVELLLDRDKSGYRGELRVDNIKMVEAGSGTYSLFGDLEKEVLKCIRSAQERAKSQALGSLQTFFDEIEERYRCKSH